MATELRSPPSVYTVKFHLPNGPIELKDYTAVGTDDAQRQWAQEYPNAILVNIFRKS